MGAVQRDRLRRHHLFRRHLRRLRLRCRTTRTERQKDMEGYEVSQLRKGLGK